MNHCREVCKHIWIAILLIALLCSPAIADQVVKFELNEAENAIQFNGNTYRFMNGESSFAQAFEMYSKSETGNYVLTVPEARINAFVEPEDQYLGMLTIANHENADMELYICVGDKNTGVYTVTDAINTRSDYIENIHATKDMNDTFQIIDRIYLYSYEQNGERVYCACAIYVDFENYNATLLESVAAANLTAASLPTPEAISVTPEPIATATPEPTATVTPEPTTTATPEPTATATPEPTATATPEPTTTATPKPTATATPEPTATVTDEPTATVAPVDVQNVQQINVEAEVVEVNKEEADGETRTAKDRLLAYWPVLLGILILLLVCIYLIVRRKRKGGDDSDQRRRFFRLCEIDEQMKNASRENYDDVVSLEELCKRFRDFAASRLHLYYSLDMIRCFIASFAASRLIIMQGISGTGKTSLAYAFGKFVKNDACIIPVQPSWRERSDLLGYFNEFTKRFNETELLAKIYEAQYDQDVYISVLDEMNIARVEYYFAEFLSILEMPNPDEWIVSIVPDHWKLDPLKLDNGRLRLARNMWFIGTANNDDSTFAISDKVYDRAMVLDIDNKAEAFVADDTPALHLNSERFEALLKQAKQQYQIADANVEKIHQLDSYVIKHLRVAFGNRIMNQFYNFVPAYMACGGKELDGIDYILCKKVLRKLEGQNMAYIRDEVDDLCDYLDELFGNGAMKHSIDYLKRLKKMG